MHKGIFTTKKPSRYCRYRLTGPSIHQIDTKTGVASPLQHTHKSDILRTTHLEDLANYTTEQSGTTSGAEIRKPL